MPDPFDLIVVGTGSAGAGAAHRCRKAGWRVAVVDELPYGGTCALRGCDPKKVLVGAADLLDWQRRMTDHGVAGDARIDWPALMRFKRSFTDPVPAQREAAYAKAGITVVHGRARFTGPDRLEVNGDTYQARHFLLAVGARPRPLDFAGAERLVSSTDFLELDRLPRRVAFVGAGYISFEFAHVAQRAGAEVTVIGRGRPLPQFAPALVERLVRYTCDLGITLRLATEVTAIEEGGGGGIVVRTDRGEPVAADVAVHGAGRVAATEGLALDAANVATDARGAVDVNEYLRSTTNPRVYAAGDAAARPGSLPLTPVAGYEGGIVASNLLEGDHRTPEYRGIPSVVFTIPPLARVGLTEVEAQREGLDVEVKRRETSDWYTNRRVAERCAMFETLVERGTDRIVGAHLLGPHADDVINLFGLAIRQDLGATDLRHQLYAYPTAGSDVAYMV